MNLTHQSTESHTQRIKNKTINITDKRMIKRDKISIIILAFIAAFCMPQDTFAQDDRLDEVWQTDYRHGVRVDFRVNSTVVDRNYLNNDDVLDRIDSLFQVINNDTLIQVKYIEFCGTASPEGNSRVNSRLSRARMLSMEEMVLDRLDIPESIITHNDRYIAWDHLIELVELDEDLPYKEEVLNILRTTYPEAKDFRGVPIDGRIPELKALDNGRVWKLLNSRYFVKMRNAWFIMHTERRKLLEPAVESRPIAMSVGVPRPSALLMPYIATPVYEPVRRIPVMSIKTNVLELATLVANVGFEFRITPRVSLDIMGHYSPYDLGSAHRKIRVFATQPEVRYWWGESLVKGHFVGIHVPVAGFNVQLNDSYRYQDPNHALWGVGVSYGYALPINENNHWGLEFTVGFGYMDIKYDTYEGVTNGKYIGTQTRHYLGLTRLGVNLSYRINRKEKIDFDNPWVNFE